MRTDSMARACARLGVVLALGIGATPLRAQQPVQLSDLVTRYGEVPRRLVGYGLVVGLDGSGDRSFGSLSSSTLTVRSVANLLRRFNIEIPAEQMRLRNVAAVLVTAEASPYLRAGGRFEVQVAALGDATSLRGGILWITPLVTDPNEPPVATAQGNLLVSGDPYTRGPIRLGNAGRIPDGGILETDPPAIAVDTVPRLILRRPDLRTAQAIAEAINAALGAGTARATDPGQVSLKFGAAAADSLVGILAGLDTLTVVERQSARIVIDGREGTVVAGGDIRVGVATVSHRGITLQITQGSSPAPPNAGARTTAADSSAAPAGGMVRVALGATVSDVAAGLYAAGARSSDLAAIFEALRASGAIQAQVVVR